MAAHTVELEGIFFLKLRSVIKNVTAGKPRLMLCFFNNAENISLHITKYSISGAASARGPNYRDGSGDEKSHWGGWKARLQRAGAHHPAWGEEKAAEAQILNGVKILPGVLWSYWPSHPLLLCYPCLAGAGEAPLQINLKEGIQESRRVRSLMCSLGEDDTALISSQCFTPYALVWSRGEV